jgi:signal transduction histidine kinase
VRLDNERDRHLGPDPASDNWRNPIPHLTCADNGLSAASARDRTLNGALARERAARDRAERAERRACFLANASALLSTQLDPEAAVTELARIAIPILGDWSCINLRRPDESVHCLGVVHVDPEKDSLADRLRYPNSEHACDPTAVDRVLRTGRVEVTNAFPLVSNGPVPAGSIDNLGTMRSLGMASRMIVPLTARGRTLGTMSFMSRTTGRYQDEDIFLAEELALRAALAIDNARLYQSALESGARARAAAARIEALAGASQRILRSGLNDQAISDTLAGVCGEALGSGCIVYMLDDERSRPFARSVFHVEPAIREQIDDVTGSPFPALDVFHSAAGWREIDLPVSWREEWCEEDATGCAFTSCLQRRGVSDLLFEPIVARDEWIGGIVAWRETPADPFTDDDEAMVRMYAAQAAEPIENARLLRITLRTVEMREEFLAVAAHELRTPLTAIIGFSQLLTKELQNGANSTPLALKRAIEVQEQAGRLSRLVTDLLDNARLQKQPLELPHEMVDLTALVVRVIGRLSDVPGRSAVHTLVAESEGTVETIGDDVLLDQAIANLVTNAIKYSPDGGDIFVSVFSRGDNTMIEVRDQGIGISPEEQTTLFRPFSRAGRGASRAGGTGLGLYIVQQIVQLHGGTIEVESQIDSGTCFRIILPAIPGSAERQAPDAPCFPGAAHR